MVLRTCFPRSLLVYGKETSITYSVKERIDDYTYPYRRSTSCSSANQSSVTREISGGAIFTIMDLLCKSMANVRRLEANSKKYPEATYMIHTLPVRSRALSQIPSFHPYTCQEGARQ